MSDPSLEPAPPPPPTTGPLERRLRRFRILLALMILVIVACEILAFLFPLSSPLSSFRHFFFHGDTFHAAAVSGVFFVYLTTLPPRREVGLVVIAGLILEGLRSILLYRNGESGETLRYNIGACVGLISFGLLIARAVKHRRSQKKAETEIALITGLILPSFVAVVYTLLDFTVALDPLVRDHFVYVVDGSLGFQPSFALGRLYQSDVGMLFKMTTGTVYGGLPAAFALMYWLDARRGHRPPVDVLVVFLVGAVMAAPLYHAMPVIGPAPFFKKAFPDHPPVIGPLAALKLASGGKIWRNCVPSMHTTWALLLWWQSRPHSRLIRVLAYVFVAMTFLAMLGFGHHYLTDIISSFPFAMAVRAVCIENVPLRAPERLRAIVVGAALTAAWLLVIRAGAGPLRAHGILTYLAYAFTVAVTLLLHRSLARRADAAPAP